MVVHPDTGYNDYDEATQAEIRALVAQAEALGVDAESILEDVAQRTENATQKDYENAAKSAIEAAIEAAIRSSEESRSRDLGQASAEAGPATADTQAAPAAVTGPASDVRARNLATLKARMMAGQTKPTPATPPAPNQQATQAAEQEKPLPPSLSAKLQEAHRALGRDVTRSQVQRMRDSVAREVETGTTNNGGVIGKLTPKAVATRREQLQKLDADLALFDGQQATPAPEAGPTNQGATNGQGQETLLKAEQPTGAAAMVSGAPVAEQKSSKAENLAKIKQVGQQKALDRIAKGTAYFGTQEKANEFIKASGLTDTHEAVMTKPGRVDVRARVVAPAPTQAKPVTGRKPVGKNEDGKQLEQDERGVRSYVEDGIRITEPVAMRPGRSGVSVSVENRRDEFKTVDECLKSGGTLPKK